MANIGFDNLIRVSVNANAYLGNSYDAARKSSDVGFAFLFDVIAVVGEGVWLNGSISTDPVPFPDSNPLAYLTYDLDRSFSVALTAEGRESIEQDVGSGYKLNIDYAMMYLADSPNVPAFAFGPNAFESAPPGAYALREGYMTEATGNQSHAEGYGTTASGDAAHSEGRVTDASGDWAHAEGYQTTSSGSYSHAEGRGTTASSTASHAEGYNSSSRGQYCHAEGYSSTASYTAAHAEGWGTTASGAYSHAQNHGTKAASESQTALGRYNVEDANGQYAAIIGNGTSDSNRSNALTVGWDGSVDAAGDASIAGDAAIGGTLGVTGETTHESTIYVNGANVNNMWMRDEYANADYDGVPSSGANTTRTVGMIDSDDDQLARVSFRQRSDGRRCAGLEAHGFNSGGTGVWNSLWAVVDKAGNRSYEMSDPAAFREALRMRSGVVATRSVAAGSVTTVDITFSPALSSAPNVVCGLQSTQTQLMGSCSCVVTATSTTGFTVALVNNATSARNIGCYWIAM